VTPSAFAETMATDVTDLIAPKREAGKKLSGFRV
jgi:hypothetical protein